MSLMSQGVKRGQRRQAEAADCAERQYETAEHDAHHPAEVRTLVSLDAVKRPLRIAGDLLKNRNSRFQTWSAGIIVWVSHWRAPIASGVRNSGAVRAAPGSVTHNLHNLKAQPT